MKPLIIDASATLAWCMPDEQSLFGRQVLKLVLERGAIAPALWRLEVSNALLMAERKGRISASELDHIYAELSDLSIRDSEIEPFAALSLARQQNLTTYDACYLRLAVLTDGVLASLDKKLVAAAHAVGLEVFTA